MLAIIQTKKKNSPRNHLWIHPHQRLHPNFPNPENIHISSANISQTTTPPVVESRVQRVLEITPTLDQYLPLRTEKISPIRNNPAPNHPLSHAPEPRVQVPNPPLPTTPLTTPGLTALKSRNYSSPYAAYPPVRHNLNYRTKISVHHAFKRTDTNTTPATS